MQSGLYVALSSQIALDRRLDTIADNVANAGTVGFRASGVTFKDLVTGLGDDSMSFASTGETRISTEAGALRETDNPFDFAVQGDAWFAVETPAGMALTRDGRFTMLDGGQLVTLEGNPVLDAGGAPLMLDPQAGPPEAGSDGMLRQNGQMAGAVGLFEYAPGPDPQRVGNSAILPDGDPIPAVDRPDVGVVQGFVEESNVNALQELTRLIQVQRAFDNSTSLSADSESSLKEAIRALGSS